jgi:hypothetical protein
MSDGNPKAALFLFADRYRFFSPNASGLVWCEQAIALACCPSNPHLTNKRNLEVMQMQCLLFDPVFIEKLRAKAWMRWPPPCGTITPSLALTERRRQGDAKN